jgi:membrane-associated phospholipid phosphatase
VKIASAIALLSFASLPALAQDSASVGHSQKKFIKAMIAPVALIASGLAVIDKDNDNDFFINRYWVHKERDKDFSNFHTRADNYMQFAPAVAVYGLSLSGVKGKHDIANQTALLIKTEILLTAIVTPLKNVTHVLRPDGSNYHSFPSGHTTQAFAAATFLHKEYGHVSVWYSIGGYTIASAVGICRILNNKHWLSDVLVGAGIGIFSTNLVYLTHQNRWGKNGNHAYLMPTYNRGAGMYFCYQFK